MASYVLNKSFLKFESKIQEDVERAQSLLNSSNPVEAQRACKALQRLEIVQSDYSLTKALLWRYLSTVRGRQKSVMYGGRLMDLWAEMLAGDGATQEEILAVGRKFQDHFEDRTEREINNGWDVSAAKLLDILDCLLDPFDERLRIVEEDQVNREEGRYKFKCKYVIPRAWFTCIIPSAGRAFRKRHRMLSHCIRRLVSRHNLYTLKCHHYQRELKLFRGAWTRLRPCSYSGCHRLTLTFYGCMSPNGYRSRFPDLTTFRRQGDQEDPRDEEEEDADDEDEEEVAQGEVEEAGEPARTWLVIPGSTMDLELRAELECAMSEAPMAALQPLLPLNRRLRRSPQTPSTFLLEIFCPASKGARLPHTFKWRPTLDE